MPIKSPGLFQAYLRGIQRRQAELDKIQENERLAREEERKAEQHRVFMENAKRVSDDYTATHELEMEAARLQARANKLRFDKDVRAITQESLDRLMKNLPVPGATVTRNPDSEALPSRTMRVRLEGQDQEFEIPTPEAFREQEIADLREQSLAKDAGKVELLESKLEATSRENALNRTQKAEIEADRDARARDLKNLEISSREHLAELERSHERDMAAAKAKADYDRTMAAVYARNASAEKRAAIAAARAGTNAAGKPVKLTSAQEADARDLNLILRKSQELKNILDKHDWDYFKGPSFAAVKGAAGAIGGESREDWATVQRLLGEIYAIKSHELFGSALTATEKGLVNAFLTEPSHFVKASQAKSNIRGLLEEIPKIIDNIYANAGGVAPGKSGGAPSLADLEAELTGTKK